jgi:hypothetical protein
MDKLATGQYANREGRSELSLFYAVAVKRKKYILIQYQTLS